MRFVSWLALGAALSLALVDCAGGAATGGPPAPSTAPGGGGKSPTPSATPTAGSPSPAPGAASPTPSSSAQTSAAVPFAPMPDTDPFYAQPSPFPNVPPGTILASRAVTFAPYEGVAMSNPAWEIQFVSRDTNMQPIAAVATVVKPMMPATGTAEPLVVFAYAEDSLGSECAPSHSVTGSQLYTGEQDYSALAALNLGYTLVYPDSEGPYSAYASGPLAGHIGLDSATAAEQFAPLGLNAKTPVGIYGYSGGAFVSGWAATLEQTYAPNLNIVGIASGGTPASPAQIVENIDSNVVSNKIAFSLILSAVFGVNRSYPTLLTPILNAAGNAAGAALANGCGGATTGGAASPSGYLYDFTTTGNPLALPSSQAVLAQITLPLAGHTPITNVFVYHSAVDELIPVAGAQTMVNAWCAAGAQVEFYEGPNGDHVTFGDTSGPLAIAYLESRFAGLPPVVPPTSTTCNQGGA